jgi:hypothetical protein
MFVPALSWQVMYPSIRVGENLSQVQYVDFILLGIGPLAIAVGLVGIHGDWMNLVLSIFIWLMGALSVAIAMKALLDRSEAGRPSTPPSGSSKTRN